MFDNNKSREQKLLESGGTIAWASVLEAREKWQTETTTVSGVKLVFHMHLKLRVEPDGEPPFVASFGQALMDSVPFTGGSCKVVFDPADRTRIAVVDGTAAAGRPGGEQLEGAGASTAGASAAGASAPGASAPAAEAPLSVADQLTKLADLKDRGVLTDAEFASAKAKLLGGG